MTPAQLARLLALPLAARLSLAMEGGDGDWYNGRGGRLTLTPLRSPGPMSSHHIARGLAWAPCDCAVWMRAAFGEQWGRCLHGGEMRYWGGPNPGAPAATDPIDCALSALEVPR